GNPGVIQTADSGRTTWRSCWPFVGFSRGGLVLDSLFTAVRTLVTPPTARRASGHPSGRTRRTNAAGRRVAGHASRAACAARAGSAACAIEPLEDRQLLSVVYVSRSGGNDHNNGSSPNSAVASLA